MTHADADRMDQHWTDVFGDTIDQRVGDTLLTHPIGAFCTGSRGRTLCLTHRLTISPRRELAFRCGPRR